MVTALQTLISLHNQYQVKRYPTTPKHALPPAKYSDTTSNGLTKCIVDFCMFIQVLHGVQVVAWRQGNEGRYRPGAVVHNVMGKAIQLPGKWLPGLNNGIGDVTILLSGKFISVEIKIRKDKQKEDQESFEAKVDRAGGIYLQVKTFQDFYDKFTAIYTGDTLKSKPVVQRRTKHRNPDYN